MDDLRARFRRIDRLEPPDLWGEAVGRAATSETASLPRPMRAMTGILVAALLLALLVGVVAVGTSMRPQVEADERLLVTSECALVSVSLDGGDDRTIIGGGDQCIDAGANLQTDGGGGRIALRTTCGACFGFEGAGAQWVGVIEVSTGEVRELDACAPGEAPLCLGDISISPDGLRVAYTRWNLATDLPELVLADLETDDRRTVPLPVLPFSGTSWTPDSEAVIVSAGEELVGRLYRVPFDGDPTVIVEAEGIGLSTVAVSPDGRSVAYVTAPTADVPPEVRRASIDGSESETVWSAPGGGTFIGISWSSDSARLAVTEVPQEMMTGPLSIHLIDVESGAQSTPYETDGACCRHFSVATWSADGQTLRLALDADPDLRGTLAIPADGSGPVQVLSEKFALGWVAER
jgi:WD40 repeat protein